MSELVLTQEEKEYLENFLYPFKEHVDYIKKEDLFEMIRVSGVKLQVHIENKELLVINFKFGTSGYMTFPDFEPNRYYKGMTLGKKYSLKELGLFQGGE